MNFQPKETLSKEEVEQGLAYVLRDGMATHAVVTLTAGTFLVAFALQFGASNFVVGLLAGIGPAMQLLQIPAIYIVERVRNRRLLTFVSIILARASWLVFAFIPALPFKWAVPVIIAGLMTNGAFGALSSCAWNSWMRDLIPTGSLGAFFSRRLKLGLGVGIILSLLGGFLIDHWAAWFPGRRVYAFSILFFLGFLTGMLGAYFLSRTPEPLMAPASGPFGENLRKPFRDKNFKRLLRFLVTWNFAANLAAPFFTVYMLKRLELDMSLVIGLLVLSQGVNFALLQTWGRISDRFSNKAVLGVSASLFILCAFAWTFTTFPERHALTLPLLVVIHILLGISTAGTTLSSANIGLKLAPAGEATPYLAASTIMNNIAAGVAPIIGGMFADFFEQRELFLTLSWRSPDEFVQLQTLSINHWDFFFLLAVCVGLVSLYFLSKVREEGDVSERIVVGELIAEVQRNMRNFSTAGGMRHMLQFPLSLIARRRAKRSGEQEEEDAPLS
ncbi:MAG: MFS transporter [bacterium]|nr:MFS transporter [bacterium]